MTLPAFSYAAAFVAYAALSVVLAAGLLRGRHRDLAYWGLTVAVVLSAGWALLSTVAIRSGSAWVSALGGVVDLLRYAAWLLFALALLRHVWQRKRLWIALGLAGAVVTLFVAGALTFPRVAGDWQVILARNLPLMALGLPVMGLVLMEQVYRSASADARWHIKPIVLGIGVVFLYDIYLHSQVLLFARLDADSLAMRGVAHAVPVVLLFMGVQRRSEWGESFQLSQAAAFHTAALMLSGGYLLALAAVGYYVRNLGGDWGRALAIILVCLGLIALTALLLSTNLRARLRVFVSKHFFRYRYDYRSEWLRFTAMLSQAASPPELGGFVVRGLAAFVNGKGGALWYRAPAGGHFVQAARWNSAASDGREPVDSPFAAFLATQEWVFDLDACRADPTVTGAAVLPPWLLQEQRYWLVVPLLLSGELHGFVVLERAQVASSLNWEVRDLLKTAGRQAAGVLALMHATDALLEARKFEAFNKMSAFVVHDLKNIVAQLSLMMQNARRLKDNAEFQEDMLATVDNSLEKMRRLMLQLRSGETPSRAAAGVSLTSILERLRVAAAARGRTVGVRVVDPVDTRGHEDRVERVLGHFVDNALDATKDGGDVQVVLEREGSQAKVTVSDTGPGMTREFVESQLFKPFSSTKESGMGIGAYESRQYIVEIGGAVGVDSEPGHGTSITVRLPALETGQSTGMGLYSSK